MPSNQLSPQSGTLPNSASGPAEFDVQPESVSTTAAGETSRNGLLLDQIAAESYHLASMLLGEGEDTVRIVEEVVTRLDLSASQNPKQARQDARISVAGDAIALLAQRDPGAFASPGDNSGPASCIEDDELDAAGVTRAELKQMLTGQDQQHLRGWLEGLAVSLRVIFVLRAVAGLSSGEVAGVLGEHGGLLAQDWTPDAVRSIFRQGLCSLASQLLHASNTQ